MTHRIKSIVFMGIAAMAAVVAWIVVQNKTAEVQPVENIPPALRISRERANAAATQPATPTPDYR